MALKILIIALDESQNRKKQFFINYTKTINNFKLLKEGESFISIFYM